MPDKRTSQTECECEQDLCVCEREGAQDREPPVAEATKITTTKCQMLSLLVVVRFLAFLSTLSLLLLKLLLLLLLLLLPLKANICAVKIRRKEQNKLLEKGI